MKKKLISLFAALLCTGCAARLTAYTETSLSSGFDTIYSYTEYCADRAVFEAHFESSVRMFRTLSDLFDIYEEHDLSGSLKEINDAAGKEAVRTDADVIGLLEDARFLCEISDGAFDITAGALMHLWHEYREEGIEANRNGEGGKVPSSEEIREVSGCRGWDHIHIDPSAQTVYIDDPCVSLDVGGIAKGYAAERIADCLEETGIHAGLINAGRSLRTVQDKPDGSPWVIAAASPDDSGEELLVLKMNGSLSFVTSGDYERFFTGEDGKKYHHILDLSTGRPADLYHSVTVITENSAYADGLSTALFTVSVKEGERILSEYEKRTGSRADAIWIMDPDQAEQMNLPCTIHKGYAVYATDTVRDTLEYR